MNHLIATSKHISTTAGVTNSTYIRYTNLIFDNYTKPSNTNISVNKVDNSNGNLKANFSLIGYNHAALVSANIDVNIDIKFTNRGNNLFQIQGGVSGDKFPSNETYLKDESGNKLFLGVSGPISDNKNTAPYRYLPFSKNREMSSFDMNVQFDKSGKNIIGVVSKEGKLTDRESWNKTFEKQDPKSTQTSTNK